MSTTGPCGRLNNPDINIPTVLAPSSMIILSLWGAFLLKLLLKTINRKKLPIILSMRRKISGSCSDVSSVVIGFNRCCLILSVPLIRRCISYEMFRIPQYLIWSYSKYSIHIRSNNWKLSVYETKCVSFYMSVTTCINVLFCIHTSSHDIKITKSYEFYLAIFIPS